MRPRVVTQAISRDAAAIAYDDASMSMSPGRRQYLDIKRRFPQPIVFFRMGDFYETFDDDAQARREGAGDHPHLEAAWARTCASPSPASRTTPSRSTSSSWSPRLQGRDLRADGGPKAGEEASSQRDVVRVVTPGTVVEEDLLSAAANNYLVAVCAGFQRIVTVSHMST